MKEMLEMLALVDYYKANEAIQIAKGKYELPGVTIQRRVKRIFNHVIHRNHGR